MIQYKTCYQRKGKTEYVTKWNTYYVWFSRIRCLFFVFVFGGGGGEDRARQTGPNRLEKPNQTDRTELIERNLFFFSFLSFFVRLRLMFFIHLTFYLQRYRGGQPSILASPIISLIARVGGNPLKALQKPAILTFPTQVV